MEITSEMRQWYEDRTARHIDLVKKYCRLIDIYETARFNHGFEVITDPSFGGSGIRLSEMECHDKSKLEEPERTPYIYISWQYKMKDEKKEFQPPADIKEMMSRATFHHIKYNPHHPEAWDDSVKLQDRDSINRDKPISWTVTDASKMPDFYIAEMVADWMAISEEKGTSVKDWADKNVNIRWKFTEQQTALIYELISEVWR